MDKGTLALFIPILAMSIPLTAIVGGMILAGLKIWKNTTAQHSRQLSDEEMRLLQELAQGLAKMEARVQALETLLLDQHRQRRENQQ